MSVFQGHVPCGKRVTVGYPFPLGPHLGELFDRNKMLYTTAFLRFDVSCGSKSKKKNML